MVAVWQGWWWCSRGGGGVAGVWCRVGGDGVAVGVYGVEWVVIV